MTACNFHCIYEELWLYCTIVLNLTICSNSLCAVDVSDETETSDGWFTLLVVSSNIHTINTCTVPSCNFTCILS